VLLYAKILEGLQQKLEGLEPVSPIAGAAAPLAATKSPRLAAVYTSYGASDEINVKKLTSLKLIVRTMR